LIDGAWRSATSRESFVATNPHTGEPLGERYPVSEWADIDAALGAASRAAAALRSLPDAAERIAGFLDTYAAGIEARGDELAAAASLETALLVAPRLRAVEIPRTTGQLRMAAAAAREGSWARATIDTKLGLRSMLAPIGPAWVLGPNNFPFAFNGISGGDFAAAIAAGNPVIAKGHPLHPTTTRLLAEIAHDAVEATRLPAGTVQLLYHVNATDGLRAVADPRLRAIAFTGSRVGGLKLKAAADAAGKPFFGEMSSVNPVVLLPGALADEGGAIADAFVTSVLMGSGQFCTKPGLMIVIDSPIASTFIEAVRAKLSTAPVAPLFSAAGRDAALSNVAAWREAGADVLVGGAAQPGAAFAMQHTLCRVSGDQFLKSVDALQREAFGNAALVVVATDVAQACAVIESLEGNLTGTIYSAKSGADDESYARVASVLRPRVGRLIDDKMPTGVAVSPAMNHGGPFPATSQPHFTAVGIPASMLRFTQLECFDNVRPHRLPPALRDANPTGRTWRSIDGTWTQADVS
jgi:NADP-dependent aldehyde dehydrogenase